MFDQHSVLQALNTYRHTPDYHFWKDSNNVFRMMNESMAKDFGHKSDAISFEGITDYQHLTKAVELADEFIKKDQHVIYESKAMTMLELFYNCNDELHLYYVRKNPIIDNAGKVIGVAGYAADSTHCPLIRSAILLLSNDGGIIGKKSQQVVYHLKPTYDNFNLSSRESEALYYMIRGNTAKETGQRLNIHYKTVEKYHENIKRKLDCKTKSQIIEKAIANGAAFVIPKSIFCA